MKSAAEYIKQIRECATELRNLFGVQSLRLFGSVARDQHHDGSDIDVCVDMPPSLFKCVGLKQYLEDRLQCPVDVVRLHRGLNPFLIKEIERDGISVF